MKPPVFEYAAPTTLEEALTVLGQAPDDTKLLAGGQSLVPMLNMRLVRPQLLLDLNRISELQTIAVTDGKLRLGALVRQRRLETDARVRAYAPLLSAAAAHVAHLQIRMRGTLGGSLAHADPSAELPAAVCALGGALTVQRAGGQTRRLTPEAFFVGAMATALEPDEALVQIEINPPPPGSGWAFEEVSVTHGAFALAGAAAWLHLAADGRIDRARLTLCGVDGRPYSPAWLEEMLVGQAPAAELFERAGARLRQTLAPAADRNLSAESRRSIAGALTTRALAAAHQRAAGSEKRA